LERQNGPSGTVVRKILFSHSVFPCVTSAEAAYLDLAWDLNQEPDFAGHRVYYGTLPGDDINFVDVWTDNNPQLRRPCGSAMEFLIFLIRFPILL
jgi:hypothetical protein